MSKTFTDLVALMDRLRSPGGCAGDREQTYATLAPILLDEAYDDFRALQEARQGRPDGLPDEHRDLPFQITFVARDASQRREDTITEADHARVREEIGDLMFAVTNIARHMQVEPEAALKLTNGKFRRRFGFIEGKLREQNRKFDQTTLDELEELWQEAKATQQ